MAGIQDQTRACSGMLHTDNCAICMDAMDNLPPQTPGSAGEITPDGRYVRLECGHAFHSHCVVGKEQEKGFLHTQSDCPLCRRSIKPDFINSINSRFNKNFRILTTEDKRNQALSDRNHNPDADANDNDNELLWNHEARTSQDRGRQYAGHAGLFYRPSFNFGAFHEPGFSFTPLFPRIIRFPSQRHVSLYPGTRHTARRPQQHCSQQPILRIRSARPAPQRIQHICHTPPRIPVRSAAPLFALAVFGGLFLKNHPPSRISLFTQPQLSILAAPNPRLQCFANTLLNLLTRS